MNNKVKEKENCTISPNVNNPQQNFTTRITRAKAIRMKCLDCCAYQPSEVRLCNDKKCPLYRYRMGHEEKDSLNPGGCDEEKTL